MSIENMSLNHFNYTKEGVMGYRLYEREDTNGGRDLRLIWSTMRASDVQKEFVISCHAWGYPKGQSYYDDLGDFNATVPASECHESAIPGGRAWWSHDLQFGGLMDALVGSGGVWTYASRKYDQITLQFSMYSNYKDGVVLAGQTHSDTTWPGQMWIGAIPAYVLTGAYYDVGDLLTIEYSTTWTRIDDRFCLEYDQNANGGPCRVIEDGNLGQQLTYQKEWGTIAALGKIQVDGSKLTTIVAGKQLYLNVRMNAFYRPIDMDYSNVIGTLTVKDRRTSSTPRLRIVSIGETVRIATSDAGGGDVPSDRVIVKMDGSKYAADQVDVAMGETAEFRFPPLGTYVSFQAVGYTTTGATSAASNRVGTETPKSGNAILLDPVRGTSSDRIRLKYRLNSDMGWSFETSSNMETVKLAGRQRPSAYYGVGGNTSVSFEGALLNDPGTDVESLPERGDLMVRFPDGRRYCIAPKVSVKRKNTAVVTVSISGDEVGG